ncbi:DUF1289 domain-containing protein [Amantichitinum ursilacus]|uniref:Fe-S protein n=1 Tax=Amantichitinum ursilacus TaxID=857265 RepID=A0A0N0XH77_9NEIS|nr:DUF1289 domain-containing protein [Amantichitinum ursilacus]KPC50820.1 hypothetical protein WG78_16035 [Amantichitinum ursilacus]
MSRRPDSPCIAMCSTGLGDDVCRGCGRTFLEVANWSTLDAAEREQVWQRLEQYWAQQGETAPWLR